MVIELLDETFFANSNIGDCDKEEILADVEDAFEGVLQALRIDTEKDHNTQETAKRVAKMYVEELFKGRYTPVSYTHLTLPTKA